MPVLPLLVVAATACGSQNNLVAGDAPAGAATTAQVSWPFIQINEVGSSFGSEVALFDGAGNPTGARAWVVIMADRAGLCEAAIADRSIFRKSPIAYQAVILFLPLDRLGTFVPGRPGDDGTFAEVIGTFGAIPGAPPVNVAPFTSVASNQLPNFVALTDWENGASRGNFNLFFADPNNANFYPFQGQFQASACAGLDGTLLP
jgi:hypothetical protein